MTHITELVDDLKVRAAIVRMRTSPLVEIRLRWPRTNTSPLAFAADAVLAEWFSLDQPGIGITVPYQLSAHVNALRFGLAATCWSNDWRNLLDQLTALLDLQSITDRVIMGLRQRILLDLPHRRGQLDAVADRECLAQLLPLAARILDEVSPQDLAAVISADVVNAAERLRGSAPLVVVVGDIDPGTVAREVTRVLAAFGPSESREQGTAVLGAGPVFHVTATPDHAACRFMALAPAAPPDSRATADVLATSFGDHQIGLIVKGLRSQLGVSYDARCAVEDLGPARVLACKATVPALDARRAVSHMSDVVHHVGREGLPGELLIKAREKTAKVRLLCRATQAGLAAELVKALATGLTSYEMIEEIDEIRAVSAADVVAFSERYLRTSRVGQPQAPHPAISSRNTEVHVAGPKSS
jgi:predicted Zn-dependent peptidase